MDSNRITANSLEENPRMQHNANTTNTINDLEPAGFIKDVDGLVTVLDDIVEFLGLEQPKTTKWTPSTSAPEFQSEINCRIYFLVFFLAFQPTTSFQRTQHSINSTSQSKNQAEKYVKFRYGI